MQVAIQYCVVWNYHPRASGLAAEIKGKYPDATVKLVQSSGGAFEVTVDGTLVFSKLNGGRHAQPGEVVRLIGAKTSPK